MDRERFNEITRMLGQVRRIIERISPQGRAILKSLAKGPRTKIQLFQLKDVSSSEINRLKAKGLIDFENGRWFLTREGGVITPMLAALPKHAVTESDSAA